MGEDKFLTPDVSPRIFKVAHKNAENMIGAALKSEEVIHYLSKTGLSASVSGEGEY